MKKLICVLLCAVMLAASLPIRVLADGPSVDDFLDLKDGAWYMTAVGYCVTHGFMSGTSATTFEPSTPVTRAMFVTMLAAYDGADLSDYSSAPFSDVPDGKWFTAPVAWAAEEGIVAGTGDGKFSPSNPISRGELAVMLRSFARYAGLYTEYLDKPDAGSFADGAEVPAWAKSGVEWACGFGLMTGVKSGDDLLLASRKTATRAEAAVMMMNLDVSAAAPKTFTVAGNDISLYTVIYPAAADTDDDLEFIIESVAALRGYVRSAFGVTLPAKTDASEPSEYEIVVGRTSREDAGLVTVDVGSINELDYEVNVQGNRLVMAGFKDNDRRRGTQYAVYDFCEDALGYHFFADALVVRDNVSTALPSDYSLTGGRAFQERTVYWKHGWDKVYLNHDNYYNTTEWVHNLPKIIDSSLDITDATPCLSDEYHIQKVIDRVRRAYSRGYECVWLSGGDNNGYCMCDDCVAAYREDGSRAATVVRLCNRIIDELHDDYPNGKLKTLAYLYTTIPPKVTTLRDNVIVYYCPISACVSHTYFDSTCKINSSIKGHIEGWTGICSEFYLWDYSANFDYSTGSLPNLHVIRDNTEWMYEMGACGVFNNAIAKRIGEFEDLRAFLLTRLYRDPLMSAEEYQELMNGYLKAACGSGWRNILDIIELFEESSKNNHFSYSAVPSSIYDYGFIAENADLILAKYARALEKAETAAQKNNVEYMGICINYLVQSAVYQSRFVNGTQAQREAYCAANDALYATIKKFDIGWSESHFVISFNRELPPDRWYH